MSECREVQLGEVCYTSAGVSQTLFVTHVYDHDGSLVAVVYHDVAGNPVDTTGGTVTVGRCVRECDELLAREPWHVVSLLGEQAVVAFTTLGSVLPEAVANAIGGTVNPANPSGLNRFFVDSVHDSALVGGGTWTEPGVTGSVASNPAGWYGYTGPVSNTSPALWPYSALRLQVSPAPACAPPPTVDVSMSFQWRYDGPHLPPLAAPAQVGDLGVIAWMIDISGPTVVAQATVTELPITAIGQTGVVSFTAPGLTVAQANNIAVVIAVNPVEGGATVGDFTLPSGSTYLKNTGWSVSQLSLGVTGDASCPQCNTLFREVTCDGVRWRDGNDNIIPAPTNAEYGPCQTVLNRVEVCVDTGTAVVEAWVVHVRDAVSGVILSSFMEDAQGATVTGTVVECPCEPPAVVPNYPLVQRSAYASGGWSPGKWDAPFVTDCGPYSWAAEVYVDGVIVFTVPSTPIPTAADALNFMNVTLAGYFAMDGVTKQPTMIDPAVHQEMVNIIETAPGPQCANTMYYSYINWDAGGWGTTGYWDTFSTVAPTPSTASSFGYRGP